MQCNQPSWWINRNGHRGLICFIWRINSSEVLFWDEANFSYLIRGWGLTIPIKFPEKFPNFKAILTKNCPRNPRSRNYVRKVSLNLWQNSTWICWTMLFVAQILLAFGLKKKLLSIKKKSGSWLKNLIIPWVTTGGRGYFFSATKIPPPAPTTTPPRFLVSPITH